jgi:hypothetical protein
MKSYKNKVLSVYGRAETWEDNECSSVTHYPWRVHYLQTPDERYTILGFGYTEADAWKYAWKVIEKEMLWEFENDRL